MSFDILFNNAIKLHEAGNFDAAERIYRQILEINPKNPDILNLLGLIAQSKGIHNQAVELFYQAIKETPNFAPLYFNLAFSLEELGKNHEAIEAYKKAVDLDKNFKEAYNNLGKLTLDKKYFQKALEIDPNYEEAHLNLAYLDKKIDKQEYFEKSEDILQLGIISFDKGNFEEASIIFRKVLANNPKSVPALINLANIETNRKEYDSAEEKYKKALDIEPDNFDAHANYANLLYHQKRLPEALEEYRKAVIINPEIAEISNNLGLILKDLGEYEEALGLLFNAFLKKPELEEISLNIFETLQFLEPSTAEKIMQNWQKIAPDNPFIKKLPTALFNQFAETYEETLKNIGYTIPQKMAELLKNCKKTIIDLGSGTGLLGEALIQNQKSKIPNLTGVDISPKMLKIAKSKNLYDQLIEDDILNYLTQTTPTNCTIAAADVFCYFENLEPLIKLCAGNQIFFSIEEGKNQTSISGRYKHNPEKIKKLLKKHGFKKIEQHKTILRYENNQPVNGVIFLAE